jgi:hypothetical protein
MRRAETVRSSSSHRKRGRRYLLPVGVDRRDFGLHQKFGDSGLLARQERIGDHENCVGADADHAEKCIIQFALVSNLDDVKLEMQDGRRPLGLLHGDRTVRIARI